MLFFVKDFLQIFYDSGENSWLVSYFGNDGKHIIFAKCEKPNLLTCSAGSWFTSKPRANKKSFDADPQMEIDITQQWGPEKCLELNGGWIPDKISIDGIPSPNQHLNGVYSRSPFGNVVCQQEMPFSKQNGHQVTYNAEKNKWFLSEHGNSGQTEQLAKCVAMKFIGKYQDLMSCIRGKWQSVKDSKLARSHARRMRILDKWDICPDSASDPTILELESIYIDGWADDALSGYFYGEFKKESSSITLSGSQECSSVNTLPWFLSTGKNIMIVWGEWMWAANAPVKAAWQVVLVTNNADKRVIAAQCYATETTVVNRRAIQDLRRFHSNLDIKCSAQLPSIHLHFTGAIDVSGILFFVLQSRGILRWYFVSV